MMKRKPALLVIIVGVLLAFGATASKAQMKDQKCHDKIIQLYQDAVQDMQKNDYDQAEKANAEGLALCSKCYPLATIASGDRDWISSLYYGGYTQLAGVNIATQKYDQAIVLLQEGMNNFPEQADLYQTLIGNVKLIKGRVPQASSIRQ